MVNRTDPVPHAEGDADRPGGPDNLVVLLLDSLNHHMLGSYGGTEFETPNLDRFARERAVRFTSHVTGSLPCMPARHDILCGSLDFLWRPWGSIEVWEEPITAQLRRAGVTTMLVSDHPHLFEVGGENYHTDFSAWDYVRGHEGDPWRTYRDPSYIGAPALPARGGGWYWRDRLGLEGARATGPTTGRARSSGPRRTFPGPRTMRAAADWLRRGAPADAPFMLFVDEFDPHEPFDTPEPWAGRYDPDWDGERLIWPPYDVGAVGQGRLSEREGRQIRANYGAKLSMIDHWVGRGLRRAGRARTVGQHGGHRVHRPRALSRREGHLGQAGRDAVRAARPHPAPGALAGAARRDECDALTTNVDIHATIADVFGVARPGDRARRIAGAARDGRRGAGAAVGASAACSGTGCR